MTNFVKNEKKPPLLPTTFIIGLKEVVAPLEEGEGKNTHCHQCH
jgi:hypothetical protein